MDMTTPSTGKVKKASMASLRNVDTNTSSIPSVVKRKLRLAYVLVPVSLIFGVALGALIERKHFHAAEAVVSVNGVIIDKTALDHRLQMLAGTSAVRTMVGEELQLQYAKKMGAFPSETEVDARYAEMSKSPNFATNLVFSHKTIEDVKRTIRVLIAHDKIIGKDVRVTEEEIRSYYNAQTDTHNAQARFYTPETASIAVIVTRTQEAGNKALHDLTNGVPFNTVISTHSVDISRQNNGLLTGIPRGRTPAAKVPGFEDAIFNLKIGGQTGPQKFNGLWWIIRCVEKSPAMTEPYDKVHDLCRMAVLAQKGGKSDAAAQEGFKTFQQQATIQAFWPQYRAAVQIK